MLSVPVLLPSMKMRDGVWRLAVWPSDDKDGADYGRATSYASSHKGGAQKDQVRSSNSTRRASAMRFRASTEPFRVPASICET